MKKITLLVMPLMAVSLLVSCGGGEKPKSTYTITIEDTDTDHFYPTETSFTFKKDDFSPIALSYTTDQDYLVLDAKASDDAAECQIDYRDDEDLITIIPSKNTNFTVQVTMTHFSKWSIIRIKSGENFHPDTNRIVFRNDDFSPKTVHYALDECDLKSVQVDGSKATFAIDSQNQILTITPKINGSILVEVTVSEQYKNIAFNPNEGTLADGAAEIIRVPYNSYWGNHVDPTVQYASKENFAFKGWSFTENPALGSFVLPPTYTLRKNDPTTAYAVYQHDVQLTSESLDFDSIEYYPTTKNIAINFNLKNDKYLFPIDINSFTVTNSSGSEIEIKSYEVISPDKASIRLPMDADIGDGLIKISAEGYQPEYSVDTTAITPEVHLTYSSEITSPKRGEDFVFTLEAINPSPTNDTYYYYAPDQCEQINIGVKEGQTYSRLPTNAYKIEFAAEDTYHLKGTVTVFGKYVKGDLKIDAAAIPVNGYFYALSGYGVTFEENQSDYLCGFFDPLDPEITKTIKLFDDEAAKRVTGKNVAVKAVTTDGVETWYSVDEFPSIVYDEVHKMFVLHDNKNNIKSVFIHAFDPQYSVFANASWGQLDELASLPGEYIDDWFEIGETKVIQVNNLAHTLRIIGFNHDDLTKAPGKAGLTIEFANVMTNSDGSVLKTCWDEDYNTNFPGSVLNNLLNSIIGGAFPSELQSVMKEVDKPVSTGNEWKPNHLYTKIFPLSCHEMNKDSIEYARDEGTTYEYYMENAQSKRVKTAASSGSGACVYWTRSPYTYTGVGAYVQSHFVNENGEFKIRDVFNEYGFAPAFCI
ncbi:MAG: DUF6273 domain-containing protein [Bacilli bacterium]|nr:DUF6273 domain-containing protein [Bacilli bacterium]